jgi:hypothetical protein
VEWDLTWSFATGQSLTDLALVVLPDGGSTGEGTDRVHGTIGPGRRLPGTWTPSASACRLSSWNRLEEEALGTLGARLSAHDRGGRS